MSFPWQDCGAFYPKRDGRNHLPIGGYSFSATETYAAKARSRPFLVDRESLKVTTVPVTREQFEVQGVPWDQVL